MNDNIYKTANSLVASSGIWLVVKNKDDNIREVISGVHGLMLALRDDRRGVAGNAKGRGTKIWFP